MPGSMPTQLPDLLTIRPIPAFDAVVRIPGSKSLTNRALLLAALADGPSTLTNVLFADDTRLMMDALRALGVVLDIDEPNSTVTIHGRGGALPATDATLFLGNAGTAMRFLTGACAASPGLTATLDGIPRMRERPIGELVEMLRHFSCNIEYTGHSGYPPLRITGQAIAGGSITLTPTLSSQYISALIQIGPLMRKGLHITFDGPVTSAPYVAMTCRLMQQFGIDASFADDHTAVTVPTGAYKPCNYAVEPDASNASYFLAAAAATRSRIHIPDLDSHSLQGDARFAQVLQQMRRPDGTLAGIDADLNDIPDAAMTIATLAVLADGPTTIRNVGNWRVKETDRMAAMQTELTKLGAGVRVLGDDITITPPPGGRITPPTGGIDTYDDHRMAMSFAVIGLAQPGITINDPACVNKTFPTFWETLNSLGPAVDLPGKTASPAS